MVHDVLVVDDEADIRDLISDILVDEGFKPRTAKDSSSAFKAIEERVPAALILDIWLQGSQLDGLGILESVKRKHPYVPVIMISGHGNIETAVNSIKLGAYDYIEKPFKEDRLLRLIRRAIETTKLQQENAELKIRGGYDTQLVGKSSVITQLAETILRVAPTESRVLISGPAGSGKGMVARMLYQRSKRAAAPFIVLNSGSIAADALEAELFGREETIGIKGGQSKVGLFERAHGGTLLIDEVTELSLEMQTKLLRILQSNSFERVGGTKPVAVDVRIIATTNKDIQQEIRQGRFREDLYYRLNVVPIKVPSLKERKDDIPLLTRYFIKRCAHALGIPARPVEDNLIAAMEMYEWPGNVRQLKNVIEWLLIMSQGSSVEALNSAMLPPEIVCQGAVPREGINVNTDMMGLPLRSARELFERQYLKAQLDRFNGNISKTASFIGMERSAFHRKLKLLSINNGDEE
jgi:two-component system, NtrC family, nitrogen regulation response regulator NtrX